VQRQDPGGRAVLRVRAAGVVLLAAYLLLVAWITLRPLDVTWVDAANLRPLAGIRADLALSPWTAARRIGGGLLLLAPLGVLLPMLGGRLSVSPWSSLARTVTAGALISMGIELLQTGVPGQVVDIDSLLLNTAGVALAHLAVVPAGRAVLRRRKLRRSELSAASQTPGEPETHPLQDSADYDGSPQGVPPTIPRVGIAP